MADHLAVDQLVGVVSYGIMCRVGLEEGLWH